MENIQIRIVGTRVSKATMFALESGIKCKDGIVRVTRWSTEGYCLYAVFRDLYKKIQAEAFINDFCDSIGADIFQYNGF